MARTDSQPGEVDISDDTTQILLDCEANHQNHADQLQPYICMVPSIYRDQNPMCFDPRVVSIGPLHRGHKNVQELAGLKVTYLHDLLARSDSPSDQTLETCMRKVKAELNQIKACYAGMKTYSDVELVKIMVMDAFFIIEFILKCSEDVRSVYSRDRFLMSSIVPDLLLIENQIPFFVLQDIFELTVLKFKPTASLITLLLDNVLKGVNFIETEDIEIDNHGAETNYKHILDIQHKCYQPPPSFKPLPPSATPHSAVELDSAGVSFKPNRDGIWKMAMEYESSSVLCFRWPMRKPCLGMPVLSIDDITEQLFRNLIAYEQSSPPTSYYVTSYAWAMNMLVDNTKDFSKLVESNVIAKHLGSNENGVKLIKGICKDVFFTEFSYEEQWKQLDDYYNDYWPKNIAWLRRTYFNSPWNIIALMAGIILFALTVVQTIFTIKATYIKP